MSVADPDLELRREGGTLFFVYHSPCLLFFLLQFSFFFNPEWGGLCAPGPSPRSTTVYYWTILSLLVFFLFFFAPCIHMPGGSHHSCAFSLLYSPHCRSREDYAEGYWGPGESFVTKTWSIENLLPLYIS